MNKIKIDNYYKPESKTLRIDEVDYTIIPNSDIKTLLDKLQQENQSLKKENKILRENTEHNDKVVDKVNWENQLLKKENKQLKDNWNKLKEWVNKHYDYYMNNEDYIGGRLCFTDMKDKMQELEQGSDSNVKD